MLIDLCRKRLEREVDENLSQGSQKMSEAWWSTGSVRTHRTTDPSAFVCSLPTAHWTCEIADGCRRGLLSLSLGAEVKALLSSDAVSTVPVAAGWCSNTHSNVSVPLRWC